MHVFGKILIWLTIPAAIAAIIFMSQMIGVRNDWAKKISALEKQNATDEQNLTGRMSRFRCCTPSKNWPTAVPDTSDRSWRRSSIHRPSSNRRGEYVPQTPTG
jgi:hypothetical protein